MLGRVQMYSWGRREEGFGDGGGCDGVVGLLSALVRHLWRNHVVSAGCSSGGVLVESGGQAA